jgi:hypothetical protein
VRRSSALALVTGFSGLGSETLYFKLLDQAVGASPLVACTVVSTFLLGVGAGSLLSPRITRPWIVEATLAAYNLIWFLSFGALLSLNGTVLSHALPWVGANTACVLLGILWVAPVALLLGVSFPAAVEDQKDLARPYLLNALGAAVGILSFEAVLFPLSGIPGCLLALVIAHGASAAILFGRQFFFPRAALGRLSGDLIATGATTGAFQGVWLFLALLLFPPFYFVQPAVVASMLIGILLGSLLWIRARPDFPTTLTLVLGGITTSVVLVWGIVRIPEQANLLASIVQIPIAILPAAVPIGALLPAYVQSSAKDRSSSGAALFSISIGNALGAFIAGTLLLANASPVVSLALPAVLMLFVLLNQRVARLSTVGVLMFLTALGFASAIGEG